MKNLLKVLSFVLICSVVTVACDKDDDDKKPVKLTSVAYSPNKAEAKLATAFSSAKIKLTPSNAKASFTIKSITKDTKAFTDTKKQIKIAADGKLSVAKSHTLEAGVYAVTVEAIDKGDKKNKKTTTYTLTIKK
ncbi:MAG: hypothetical protein N4A71_23185 [Carboxylicivirga sp.]|jgi:hypothetical protein|nr:hypothetical protein [Carboxylicivirga sp.]MCT4647058.1 hypothetical protein [Carboxylicivirga sp.]